MKKVELPHNTEGYRGHRVLCLTTCGGELWGGCSSGFVFCYCGDEEEEGKGKGKEEGEELILCHQTQLLEQGGVSAMVGEKEGLVWVGGDNGWISVWKSGYGPVIGEKVKFSAPLLPEGIKQTVRHVLFDTQKSGFFFKLEYGELKWKGGAREESLSLKKVREMKVVEGKQGGVGVVLIEEGKDPRKFELGGEEGRKMVDCLKFALFCLERERVLERVGQQHLSRKVTALEMVGGRVWSFDESLMVCSDSYNYEYFKSILKSNE